MADSEHDDMFEDAEGSGDDLPRAKTRKTASGRVLIHSKEGDSFSRLNSTYAVLLGGEVVDRAMLLEFLMERIVPALQTGDDVAQRAAAGLQTEPIGLSVDGMVKGRENAVGATVHSQIVASHPNPVVIMAIEHVTGDGSFTPIGHTLVFESYTRMTQRAAGSAGRSVQVEHAKREEGILMTVRGLGAIDDTNIDAYGDAFAACFGASVTTLMRENAVTESGQFAENSSTGGVKFHLAIKPELLQVPDMLSFNMRTSEGETQEILVNRFEN
eukprot:2789837-Prymnesium_polylepis.1